MNIYICIVFNPICIYICIYLTSLALFGQPVPPQILETLASKNRPLVAHHARVSYEEAGEMIAADKNLGFVGAVGFIFIYFIYFYFFLKSIFRIIIIIIIIII